MAGTAGQEAIDLAASAGLMLDPWQCDVLNGSLGERSDGTFAATEVGLIVPRQNGKGAILEAGPALHSLYLSSAKLVLWSAHEFKTCKEAFNRVVGWVENADHLRRRVKAVRRTTGEEAIELIDGSRMRFIARSRSSGRGFSPDVVILDEALVLDDEAMAALFPSMSARALMQAVQIWYVSSAPKLTSMVLRRVGKRGRHGTSTRLAYFEWCAANNVASDDVNGWLQANPGIGYRLSLEFTARELEALDDEDFRRERLGIWSEDLFEQAVDMAAWRRLADRSSRPADPVALAVDVTPDRKRAAIGAAGQFGSKSHVEVVDTGAGTGWVVDRLVQLVGRHQPCVVVLDARGPAASLLPALEAEGLKRTSEPRVGSDEIVVTTSASEMAHACGAFEDAIANEAVAHLDDPALNEALEAASKRPLGDLWAWSRRSDGDISPLVAVTLAHHGLAVYGQDKPRPKAFAAFG